MITDKEIVKFQILLAVGLTMGAVLMASGWTMVYFSISQDTQTQAMKLSVISSMMSIPESPELQEGWIEQHKKLFDTLDESTEVISYTRNSGYTTLSIGSVIFIGVIVYGMIFMRKL